MTSTQKKEKPTCPVCIEIFTTKIRQPVQCPYCPHATCRQCCSRYLTTTFNDPHCMECKREWNREFIDTHLTATFRKGPLKLHRRKVLMDRERGRLPAMQVFVEAQVEMQNANLKKLWALSEKSRLKIQRQKIQASFTEMDLTNNLTRLLEQTRPIDQALGECLTTIEVCNTITARCYRILNGQEKTVKQFIMKCPADECRGFLSQAWKCGTCLKHFCHDCHADVTGDKDKNHECNADAKATAQMIVKETKPCPKCGIRISKIDGCDQMWCVSCQTTWSWNSGQVLLNTVTHNPHYYEYLRRQNNGEVPREAGDVPCGGIPNVWTFTRHVMHLSKLTPQEKTQILDIHRCLNDIEYARMHQYPLRQDANVNRDLDIAYLMKQIDEDTWGTNLEKKETNFERKRELGLILQTLLHVGAEKLTGFFNTHIGQRTNIARNLVKEMEDVREFTNKSFLEKGKQMGIVVPQITETWQWSMSKRVGKKVQAATTNTVVQPRVAPAAVIDDADEEEDQDRLMVDMGDGEVVEMTAAQLAAIAQ